LEQHYRDVRIHPIHEGTTGIQGQDLLGRKVRIKDGKAFKLFVEEVQKTIKAAHDVPELKPYAVEMEEALEKLQEVTTSLLEIGANESAERFLADATLYLELFGIISVAWQWLVQGLFIQKGLKDNPSEAAADFFHGKFHTLRFFFAYELPKIEGLVRRLTHNDGLTVEMKESYFAD
jgi:hypothetical protein